MYKVMRCFPQMTRSKDLEILAMIARTLLWLMYMRTPCQLVIHWCSDHALNSSELGSNIIHSKSVPDMYQKLTQQCS